MNSIVVFSLLFAAYLASAFNLPEQGNYTSQQRIFGGEAVAPNEFPHQVAVCKQEAVGDKIRAYSGAFIKDQWVLTAASVTFKIDKIQVQLGMLHLGQPTYKFNVTRSNVFPHADFRYSSNANIALIKIPHVEFSPKIAPAMLPQREEHYLGTEAIASGWGFTSNNGNVSPTLQQVTLKIISNQKCSEHYPDIVINKGHICTQRDNKGICKYDIGAPLISKTTRTLIGIAVFRNNENCERGLPDGFIRVDQYMRWIRSTIKANKN